MSPASRLCATLTRKPSSEVVISRSTAAAALTSSATSSAGTIAVTSAGSP